MDRPPAPPLFSFATMGAAVLLPGIVPNRHYEALISAFDLLEEGGVQAEEALFAGEQLSGLRTALTQLIEQKVVAQFGNTYRLADRKALQRIWADERLFCSLGSWSTDHAEHMNVLLHDESLMAQAGALKNLDIFTRKNLALRLRVSIDHLNKVALFGKLPLKVQQALDTLRPSTETLKRVRRLPTEEAMLLWIDQNYNEAPAPAAEEVLEEDPDELTAVEASLKLSAAIYERVRNIENVVLKLAKELGCEVEE